MWHRNHYAGKTATRQDMAKDVLATLGARKSNQRLEKALLNSFQGLFDILSKVSRRFCFKQENQKDKRISMKEFCPVCARGFFVKVSVELRQEGEQLISSFHNLVHPVFNLYSTSKSLRKYKGDTMSRWAAKIWFSAGRTILFTTKTIKEIGCHQRKVRSTLCKVFDFFYCIL